NVDVSPDGSTIIFDLLGDIYRMPITGGDAVALTSGPAWDMQPRFSPDGESIAFTSDRGGGDNLWVMSSTGDDPTALTDESFRLINSPAWNPNGQYVVGAKHFTSRRSLGAGEMWMYHLGGGKGLQLTTRANDQKDEGEPAFSPCGRYLYTSQDATPGSMFEYSKDPNAQIYRINRLDLETGERESFITGPGGAVRPTPSPDGTLIAFVRRIRYQSVLHLMDIASGRVWPVYDQLDRDMQETWAIHGVYPSMAWMPDGKSIVLWAGGQIRRVDIATGEAAVIPFHVRQQHAITEALRTPIEVAPTMFDIKMPRWTNVSPDGSRVVFQALGHLYVRDLPEGEPRRVTAQNEHFEFCPSFSRDGNWIVYTTWDDDDLGAVRIVWADGGEGRVLTDEPGHYVDPVMSPDGKTVVFGRVSGGYLRTPIWSRDTGVYRVPVVGGPMQRITQRGTSPQFGATSDRIYLYAGGGDVELISMRLDGTDERTHVTSSNATEMRISPDGTWLAFAERFNVHLMPFISTGRPISVGPNTSSLPFRRVTSDAGSFIHWSGDSSTLYWTNGPTLSVCPVADVFAFAADGAARAPAPVDDDDADDDDDHGNDEDHEHVKAADDAVAVATFDLGFRVPYDVPSGRIAIVNARIITMRGDEVIERGTVVIEDNRIVSVSKGDLARIPDDAFVIDGKGKTVVPGYCDVHAHGPQARDGITPEQNWIHFANLAFGVTTIHDPSNQTSSVFAAAEMAKAGVITSPRTFSTGTILYGAAGAAKAEIDSLDDARFHVKRMQDVGAISVKSYNQPR
ncbi:MAG: PD40 domain-containing protein, partial [Phycisphaerales bacterium]|nr:PD40 domain-containing protein [Phycisphaerales bacterium]